MTITSKPNNKSKKAHRVSFLKESDKNPSKDRVKFPEGRRCDARYMIHLKFLFKLVFNPPTVDITNEKCPDDNQYQVFEDGKYICLPMPNRNDSEQLLKICNDLYNFLNFIINEMLSVPSGHNFKSLQDNIRKLIAIRTKVLDKIKSIIDNRGIVNISERVFFEHDTLGDNFKIRLTKKIEETALLSGDTANRYPPSAAATEAEVKSYLSSPCTIPRYDPTDLSDNEDMYGGLFIKKYKNKSRKNKSRKNKSNKNKSRKNKSRKNKSNKRKSNKSKRKQLHFI